MFFNPLMLVGLGAAVLHGQTEGLPGNVKDMTYTLAKMYSPVMGEKASLWFIVIGVFAVLYSTLFAATGSILDIRSQVTRMWVAGKEVSLENRHTRLYNKYKNRPREQ